MSEFGRTVAENGNRGTDHGHGNCMLVLGGGVAGGRVLGDWPGLGAGSRFEGRDLAVTTDYRDVVGEILLARLERRDPVARATARPLERKHSRLARTSCV